MTDNIKRFVVLRFGKGWIVWDNQKTRIVDGVYYNQEIAIEMGKFANEHPDAIDREWLTEPTSFKDAL